MNLLLFAVTTLIVLIVWRRYGISIGCLTCSSIIILPYYVIPKWSFESSTAITIALMTAFWSINIALINSGAMTMTRQVLLRKFATIQTSRTLKALYTFAVTFLTGNGYLMHSTLPLIHRNSNKQLAPDILRYQAKRLKVATQLGAYLSPLSPLVLIFVPIALANDNAAFRTIALLNWCIIATYFTLFTAFIFSKFIPQSKSDLISKPLFSHIEKPLNFASFDECASESARNKLLLSVYIGGTVLTLSSVIWAPYAPIANQYAFRNCLLVSASILTITAALLTLVSRKNNIYSFLLDNKELNFLLFAKIIFYGFFILTVEFIGDTFFQKDFRKLLDFFLFDPSSGYMLLDYFINGA